MAEKKCPTCGMPMGKCKCKAAPKGKPMPKGKAKIKAVKKSPQAWNDHDYS